MALEIATEGSDYSWHLGQNLPVLLDNSPFIIKRVVYVQADGDELTYIINKFTGIPKLAVDDQSLHAPSDAPRSYVMTWFGDHARFIVANLI